MPARKIEAVREEIKRLMERKAELPALRAVGTSAHFIMYYRLL